MGGKSSTHVANSYNKAIWVKCDAERSYVLVSKYEGSVAVEDIGSGSASVERQFEWSKIKADFTRILPNEVLRFDVDTRSTDVVYVTIIADGGEVLANALPKREDYSVMVAENGQVRDVIYGRIWQHV
ncbi:hypothetical protein CHS0354_020967 [Potamilus streckersoni]|uniref:Uncharacterized protein n=1 Tax=Potamilus streckersoni TaxID=2493646 RepID=A0AAE0SU73_9BIVA|nr:hypothetical protein CHS0354_020967 [Potamilus streckersoni]